ncbi:MAG: D-glucuronyl C5-epimerase family protein [Solirubrobacteraceae bacterium]
MTRRNDPFVPGPTLTPAPGSSAPTPGSVSHATRSPAKTSTFAKRKPAPTVRSVLARLYRTHAITRSEDSSYVAGYNSALSTEKHLSGTRKTELQAVTETMHRIAASGQLTASRLPALFATLNANRQWWTHGSLLASGARVEFAGSQLVWEYYPGQGIQLQVLGTFGKADGLYTGGLSDYPAMQQLLAQIIPLAAQRAGGVTWEYYFSFDGGSPPWTSAMSQATGLEALTRAYQATGNKYYLQVASKALAVFGRPPPSGVNVKTRLGTRFLQYTFAPRVSIINAFLQSLIGLYDYAKVSGNATAARLFASGNAEAVSEVPHFDTGAWSLYQPGIEDTLDYHELVTGFLQQLCSRTKTPVYCRTAQHFQTDLKTPPALTQLTFRARVRAHRRTSFALRFNLSKYSHVGVVVSQGDSTLFSTSASFPYGRDHFTIPALRHKGTYSIVLDATDLAGNFSKITGNLQVTS